MTSASLHTCLAECLCQQHTRKQSYCTKLYWCRLLWMLCWWCWGVLPFSGLLSEMAVSQNYLTWKLAIVVYRLLGLYTLNILLSDVHSLKLFQQSLNNLLSTVGLLLFWIWYSEVIPESGCRPLVSNVFLSPVCSSLVLSHFKYPLINNVDQSVYCP